MLAVAQVCLTYIFLSLLFKTHPLIQIFTIGITKYRQIADCEEILQQLHDLLQKIQPTPKPSHPSTPGVKKRSALQRMKESIDNAGKIAAWPLNKDETKGLLDRLQAHKTTFILTLSADSTFVSHPWLFCYCGLKYVLLARSLWIYWTKQRYRTNPSSMFGPSRIEWRMRKWRPREV